MNSFLRSFTILAPAVAAGALICPGARGELQGRLYLNEVAVADGAEKVEVYNAGPDTIDLNQVIVRGTSDYVISGEPPLPPDEYRRIDLIGGFYLDNLGGETSLADAVSGDGYDGVRYGQQGGAPLPHPGETVSLCRALDAAFGPPLYNEPGYSDAGFWTIALLSTFGGANFAPPPSLGSTARINEVKPPVLAGAAMPRPADPACGGDAAASPAPDLVELYNPTPIPIDIGGWYFTDGTAAALVGGIIPPFDVLLLNLPLQVETTLVLYLFDADGVRVDQLGLLHAPPLDREECYARCPDGAGPADGYDWTSSGGGSSLFVRPCTLGQRNCETNTVSTVGSTWGRLRATFRH